MELIERARLLVSERPAAIEGQGGNATTFGVAAVLVWGFGLSPAEALPVMLEYSARCEPPWGENELVRMLNNAMKGANSDKPRGYLVGEEVVNGTQEAVAEPETPKRKKIKELRMDALTAAQDATLPKTRREWREWLRVRSVCDPLSLTPEAYLDGLYREGERVLIFNRLWGTQGDYLRAIGRGSCALSQIQGEKAEVIESLPSGSPEGMQFFIQPVDGNFKLKSGSNMVSRRTDQSVTRWPFLLLESDNAPLEMWLNVVVRMRIRIVSITASGGRSLHALVRLDKETFEEIKAELENQESKETLAAMGCDPQALTAKNYPRLPNTWREGKRMSKLDRDKKPIKYNGKSVMHFVPFHTGRAMQSLIYYNPDPERGMCIREQVVRCEG